MSDTPDIQKWNELTEVSNYICRICMSLSELFVPIFEGEGLEQELYNKIVKYLPIKVSPFDTLPHQVCYICAGTLVAWNSLYATCIKSDQKFQSFLNSGNSSESDIKNIILEEKPLMPPKKRKVENKEQINEKNSSHNEKQKKKILVSKTIVKSKSEEKVVNKKEKNTEKSKKNVITENCEQDDSLLENSLLPEIKTECDSEDEGAVKSEDANSGNENFKSSFIKCEFCSKVYKDKKCLNRHLKKCHGEVKTSGAQRCDLCSNIYKTRANLERHYLKEHLTDQVPCPVCHTSFNSKKLDFHLKSVHGVKTEGDKEEKFKCKSCDKWFKNKYVRNSHVKEVHLSEPIKCKLCDFEGVRTVLRRHKRDVHAEKRFLCSLCPGAFKTLHTLKMHMTSHSDIRCYTCDICGMGFKRLNNVRDHMKCHEQKSNQCQICGNFFARKRYLAIHEKTIHNFYADGIIPEEKGFECGTCGAKLKWKKNLLAHMRIHTGEKPYVCKICNKDFICHGSLRTHMAKHSVCVLNEGEPQTHIPVEVNVFGNFNPEPA